MTENKGSVLIVGGGIGGLAAALAVAEAGKRSTVLEQAPEFGEVGAGIQLAPNAMAVLDRFGLSDEISKVAVFPKRLVVKDIYSGNEFASLDLGNSFKERYGHPYIVLHRSDLHRILLEACKTNDHITLLNDQYITSVEEAGNVVRVTNQNGDTYEGEALIGADGLKSNIRKFFSDDEPICSEYVAYRGTIPIEEISDANLDDVIMWIGPKLHLVQYPVRRAELYNQVVVFKSYEYKEGSDDWGTPEEMDRRFAGSHPLVQNALTFIQRQIRWPMYDRLPIGNWTKGNITLLGDAAHPMLQYLAQGGCQALEDSAYLGDMLQVHSESYNKAFLAYQEERIPRTAKVQTSARTWGEIIHAEDPVSILLRNTIFEKRSSQDYEITDFLYGYQRIAVKK
ncbi:3-hydroxybenzoate 6-hydroxylase [Bacillus sp. M6-12]|uniref:FAD-dependent monooxygenase n=1 Tax=Bacillus sp. M6-12 TaxID=2054166 RepID=UPI000C7769B9|nr:FAD-dependent monooxygenase [Bacillus sp. M6-12]PLS18584.1 3-hydroxybenzoate 6-hydroxylase [Bacillus sp. M6-12]